MKLRTGSGFARFVHCTCLAAALAGSLAVPTAAGATSVVVDVTEGTNPATVAKRYGIVPDQLFTQAANGFAVDVTDAQFAALDTDTSVADVASDSVVGTVPHKPITLARLPARSGPGEPSAGPPAQSVQFVTAAIRRVGAPASRTADIDGIDDRRVDADIAILDGGIDPYHPDLDVRGGLDCVKEPKNQRGYYDRDGHGTLAAGFAAAIDNGIGVVGVAPGTSLWAVRVADVNGYVTESSLLCDLEFIACKRTIEVANLSFGGMVNQIGPCVPPARGRKQRDLAAQRDRIHWRICVAASRGLSIVAAAGNDASNASNVTPAAYEEVIAVVAIADFDGQPGGLAATPSFCLEGERDDYFATFSNFGPVVDIAAPGVCMTSTFPGGQYATTNGTSFSAPLVAGAAALIHASRAERTPEGVRSRLRALAERGPIPGDSGDGSVGILNVNTL